MSRTSFVLTSTILVLLSAVTSSAQEVRLDKSRPELVELSGGAGPTAWRLTYGNRPGSIAQALISPTADRVYFAHGPWLRLIDSKTGIVIGRWRFPSTIDALVEDQAGAVGVHFKMPPWTTKTEMTVRFDPAAPQVPDWDIGGLASYRISEWEAVNLIGALSSVQDPWLQVIPNAASLLPKFEDMIRRDPFSPYLRLALARLLHDAGDARAPAAIQDVFNVPSTDFTEWFRISILFDRMPGGSPELGLAAFERAMGDFIKRDRDPRLIETLIARLVLYGAGDLSSANETELRRHLDRIYELAPTNEASDRAWALYADRLEQKGDPKAAEWRARAERASRESLSLLTLDLQLARDRFLLLELASILALILFILSRFIKYAPQRRMRAAAGRRGTLPPSWLGYTNWSSRERWALLILALVGWLAAGPTFVYGLLITRAFDTPIHVGAFSGFEDIEGRYPPSDERSLIQAIALQHSNNVVDAEKLYRSLPQFAESWNNLGVILARAGKAEESRQAFARALVVDTALPEAVLNSSGKATTDGTRTFQKYAAGAQMIALPGRDRLMRAYYGPEWSERYQRMLFGPFGFLRVVGRLDFEPIIIAPVVIGGGFLTLVLLVAIVMLAFFRSIEVTVPPGRAMKYVEMIVPGTSPIWGWASAPVLLAWTTLAMAAFFQWRFTTPYLTIGRFQVGIMRAFGFPIGLDDLNPPMAVLIGLTLVLWVVNAVVIRRYDRASAAF